VELELDENLPEGHVSQKVLNVSFVNRPLGHEKQKERPVPFENSPALQKLQEEEFVLELNFPISQSEQKLFASPSAKRPFSHEKQLVEPEELENVPIF
jgi:hypothetical protein